MDKEIIIYTSILTDTDNPEIQKTKKIIKPKFKQVFKVKEGDFKKMVVHVVVIIKLKNDIIWFKAFC